MTFLSSELKLGGFKLTLEKSYGGILVPTGADVINDFSIA